VVTLFDITDEARVVTLASSEPVPCSQGARFRHILAGNTYLAEVDAYDAPASALIPAGTPSPDGQAADPNAQQGLAGSGSRHMLLKATKAPIAPRWTTKCDERQSRTEATIGFDACDALTYSGSPAPTSIALDPKAALGDLACASAGGEVATVDITPIDAALPAALGVACGASPIVFDAGLAPGQVYSFRLEARAEAGGEVRWGSTCFAAADEAIQTKASCDPFSSTGSVEVDAEALASAGLVCEGEVKAFQATIEPLGISSGPVPCGHSARFLAIEPGMYDVILRQVGPTGPEAFGVTCSAVVAPGASSKVACLSAP
jgi:hypothetical protein